MANHSLEDLRLAALKEIQEEFFLERVAFAHSRGLLNELVLKAYQNHTRLVELDKLSPLLKSIMGLPN